MTKFYKKFNANLRRLLLLPIVAFLVLFSFLLNGQTRIEKYELKNGLTVILNEDHSQPEVFGLVVTKAGGKNDPSNATGLAHYMEHMLFKGTQTMGTSNWEAEKPLIDKIYQLYDDLGKTKDAEARKKIQQQINEVSLQAAEYAVPNEMDKLLKSIGSTNINAGTGPDQTMFYNVFPSNQIEKWLDLYSERFINPVFRSFQAELEVVYEEKNMYADNFSSNLIEAFQKQFFKVHPYGQQPLIGTMEHLKKPSLNAMDKFLKDYYVANNMALILVGDFNAEQIKPLIETKFGRWKSGEVPKTPVYEEKPFNGREVYKAKLSPIKIGILGFRTVPPTHPDAVALNVCNRILSNQNQTGLLDQLGLDNKLITAMTIPLPYNDHGATIILFIPKIMGQSLDDAEKLIINQLDSLKAGKFNDWMVDAVKYQFYKEFQTQMESNLERGVLIGVAFSQNRDIQEYIDNYIKEINSITKAKIIEVANKYYGKNYLAFHSKMGFPKKEKIEKPGFKPLAQKQVLESPYAQYFNKIYAPNPNYNFIDFDKDAPSIDLKGGNKLYVVKNPKNDLFQIKIKYATGYRANPMLKYVAELMNYAGCKGYTVKELKIEFDKIGCSYQIRSQSEWFEIEVDGPGENFEKAMNLMHLLLTTGKAEPSKINILIDGTKTERKMERAEPDNIAAALIEYAKYGQESVYLNRMSLAEIKKLHVDSLIAQLPDVFNNLAEIHYCGKHDLNHVGEIVQQYIPLKSNVYKDFTTLDRKLNKYNENTIYFVNRKDALQSKNYIFMNSKPYENSIDAMIAAFNLYFSGDFSGLVLQEIREFRSLAYGAGASFSKPMVKGNECSLTGYVGTQADKTLEALEVFYELLKKMPEKPERIETMRAYLLLSILTEKPDFRELSEAVATWKLRGFETDPAKQRMETYKSLTFDDLLKFYKEYVQPNAVVMAVVGDEKRMDMKSLEKFGKIVKVKEESLFKE